MLWTGVNRKEGKVLWPTAFHAVHERCSWFASAICICPNEVPSHCRTGNLKCKSDRDSKILRRSLEVVQFLARCAGCYMSTCVHTWVKRARRQMVAAFSTVFHKSREVLTIFKMFNFFNICHKSREASFCAGFVSKLGCRWILALSGPWGTGGTVALMNGEASIDDSEDSDFDSSCRDESAVIDVGWLTTRGERPQHPRAALGIGEPPWRTRFYKLQQNQEHRDSIVGISWISFHFMFEVWRFCACEWIHIDPYRSISIHIDPISGSLLLERRNVSCDQVSNVSRLEGPGPRANRSEA